MEAISSENIKSVSLGLLVAVVCYGYHQYRKSFSFWSSRGVNGPTPLPFFGNFHLYMMRSIPDVDYKHGLKYGRVYGIYEGTTPVLMVWDPDIVEKVFVTEHNSFKLQMGPPSNDPLLSNQVFFLEGEELKQVRGVITSALTGSKLKQYFDQLQFDDLNGFLEKNIGQEINFSPMFHLHMLNVVSRHFYGLDLDLFNNSSNELVTAAHGFGFSATEIFIMRKFPSLVRSAMKRTRKTYDYLVKFVSYAVDQRLEQLAKSADGKLKKDLLQNMIDANLNDIQLKANSIAMIKAGFGTTQTTLCYLSYEIAKNQDVQTKVQKEIVEVLERAAKEGRSFTYEDLNQLHFLDACITEVLRLHPVDFRTFRRSTRPTTLQYNGTKIEIPFDQLVKVPLHSLHFDETLFDNPFEYKPERWQSSGGEKQAKNRSFMAFGAGPRMCPGANFAALNAKLVMVNILGRYKIDLTPKTCVDVPRGRFAAAPEDVWIKLTRRKNFQA